MATYTENYNLTLPAENEYYNVEDFNENFETIDTMMAENEAVSNEINEKIGTPENGETVFSLLKNSGGSVIKSIQRILYSYSSSNTSVSKEINEVNPSKCIVIMERLYDTSNSGTAQVAYTLNATTLDISHGSGTMSNSLKLGFWIIEFN